MEPMLRRHCGLSCVVALSCVAVARGQWPNCSAGVLPRQHAYSVSMLNRAVGQRGATDAALLSYANGTSAFAFAFATAWFPRPQDGGDGLIVRVVECNPDHHSCANASHPEWSNAGALTSVRAHLALPPRPCNGNGNSNGSSPRPSCYANVTADAVDDASVFWAGPFAPPPRSNSSRWGDR